MSDKRKYSSIRSDIRIAKELLYPSSVIEALKNEKDPYKRTIILRNARLKTYKLEDWYSWLILQEKARHQDGQ